MAKIKTLTEQNQINTDRILFYMDNKNVAPVFEYIKSLREKTDKNSRIKYNKIAEYIAVLCDLGQGMGEPYMKHVEGDIWELRPISDRIFFAAWVGEKFILLHHFAKKSQKTPRREIETAKRRLDEARKDTEKYEQEK